MGIQVTVCALQWTVWALTGGGGGVGISTWVPPPLSNVSLPNGDHTGTSGDGMDILAMAWAVRGWHRRSEKARH